MQNLDKIATVFVDATDIEAVSGNCFEVITSLPRAVKEIQVFDTTGLFIGIFVGPSGNEVLEFVIGPGASTTTPIVIPTGARISLRSMDATAGTDGNIALNFLG